jgi:hypothetical protein
MEVSTRDAENYSYDDLLILARKTILSLVLFTQTEVGIETVNSG